MNVHVCMEEKDGYQVHTMTLFLIPSSQCLTLAFKVTDLARMWVRSLDGLSPLVKLLQCPALQQLVLVTVTQE